MVWDGMDPGPVVTLTCFIVNVISCVGTMSSPK